MIQVIEDYRHTSKIGSKGWQYIRRKYHIDIILMHGFPDGQQMSKEILEIIGRRIHGIEPSCLYQTALRFSWLLTFESLQPEVQHINVVFFRQYVENEVEPIGNGMTYPVCRGYD
jgi:hypothetical protein